VLKRFGEVTPHRAASVEQRKPAIVLVTVIGPGSAIRAAFHVIDQ
jgi:hypothetical protein